MKSRTFSVRCMQAMSWPLGIRFKSGFHTAAWRPRDCCPSYETTHSWNSEPQPATSSAVSNIEQEISNDEVWNRFALTISD
jgi:hypothetical protein